VNSGFSESGIEILQFIKKLMGIIFSLAYGWAKPKVNSHLGSLGVKQANPIVSIAFSTV